VKHDNLLDPVVAAFIAEMTQAKALAHFTAADVTEGPILDASDLAEHAYIAERGVLMSYPDLDTGQLPMHHVSPRLSATPGAIHSPAPALCEHTRALLAEMGYGENAMTAEGMT
jgi:crotonobetainyl-CoA:carnitine CoA-transferase CaiB-like acyl-CoA transferase